MDGREKGEARGNDKRREGANMEITRLEKEIRGNDTEQTKE